MDEISKNLSDFGKEVESDEVLKKMESLGKAYSYSSEEITTMILNYLTNGNIKYDKITLKHVDDFEEQKLINISLIGKRFTKPNKTVTEKININNLIFNNSGFLGQYLPDTDSSFTNQSSMMIETNEIVSDMEQIQWNVEFCQNQNYYQHIMFQKNRQVIDAIDKQSLEVIKKQISLIDNPDEIEFSTLCSPKSCSQEDVIVCGRISIDHSQIAFNSDQLDKMVFGDDGDDELNFQKVIDQFVMKLNANNVGLQPLSIDNESQSLTRLNLAHVESYSLFPGQNVLVKGKNPTRNEFIVTSIEQGLIQRPPPIDPNQVPGDLRVVIAAGPFTTKDSNDLSSLEAILEQIKSSQCHILILIGPIVDINNEKVQTEIDTLTDIQWDRLNYVASRCAQTKTHLVYVPSVDDCATIPVFPQPAFCSSQSSKLATPQLSKRQSSWLHCASNPTMFTVGPYIFGVTSADVLHHICTQEINNNCSTSRLKRVCRHLLIEQNFYPLKPAHPELSVDWVQWSDHCQMGRAMPHVLILPSKMTTFHDKIDDEILCLNPGFVKKANHKSTFFKLTIPRDFHESRSFNCKIINL